MDSIYIFTYGMLTHPSYMTGFKGKCAYLPDYALEFNYFANVYPSPGNKVWGVLWEIDKHKLELLDLSEGVPTLYTRIEKSVVTVSGEEVLAHVYTMTPESRQNSLHERPSSAYLTTVEHGYQHFSLPTAQLAIFR